MQQRPDLNTFASIDKIQDLKFKNEAAPVPLRAFRPVWRPLPYDLCAVAGATEIPGQRIGGTRRWGPRRPQGERFRR